MSEKTIVQIILTKAPTADGDSIVKANIGMKGEKIIMAILQLIHTLCKNNDIDIDDFIKEIKCYEEFSKTSTPKGVYIQ